MLFFEIRYAMYIIIIANKGFCVLYSKKMSSYYVDIVMKNTKPL